MAQSFTERQFTSLLKPDISISTWVPTYTNLVIGNGTVVAVYQEVGEVAWLYFSFEFGSTSSISGEPIITLPVMGDFPPSELSHRAAIIGSATFRDNASVTYTGITTAFSQTEMVPRYQQVAGTNIRLTGLTATTPHVWAVTDRIIISGSYRVAQ